MLAWFLLGYSLERTPLLGTFAALFLELEYVWTLLLYQFMFWDRIPAGKIEINLKFSKITSQIVALMLFFWLSMVICRLGCFFQKNHVSYSKGQWSFPLRNWRPRLHNWRPTHADEKKIFFKEIVKGFLLLWILI